MTGQINSSVGHAGPGPAPDVDQGLSNRELAAAMTEPAGHLNAATRRWRTLIAEFDRRKGWSGSSTRSCTHWLNWQCGPTLGAARERKVFADPSVKVILMPFILPWTRIKTTGFILRSDDPGRCNAACWSESIQGVLHPQSAP